MKQPFTVLILRPDYATNDFGTDTYQAWVLADTVKEAQEAAQREAHSADYDGCTPDEVACDQIDYAVLAVYFGHQEDIREFT